VHRRSSLGFVVIGARRRMNMLGDGYEVTAEFGHEECLCRGVIRATKPVTAIMKAVSAARPVSVCRTHHGDRRGTR
jgi:hypothetical protein